MKKRYFVFIIVLIFAVSQAINAGGQSTLFRQANAIVGNEYEIGVNPNVLIKCTTGTEIVKLYSIPNNLSETFHVTIWATVDPTTPFQFLPEHMPVNPGETVIFKLKHLGVPPGVYAIPVVIGIWDEGWQMNLHGMITVDKVEV